MGSVFKAPSPPQLYVPAVSTVKEAEKEQADEGRKVSATDRNRTGLSQNINTSWRGVLDEISFNPIRKSLLGE